MTGQGTSNSKSILIVSHACARAVNRAPYAEMTRLGWKVTIVTAAHLDEAGQRAAADPVEPDGTQVHLVEMLGGNARLQRFAGLREIIASVCPAWVIADIDPHSLLAVELATIKRKLRFRLGFVSCENLSFGVRALAARRGLRGALLGVFCTAVRQWVRPRTDIIFTINRAGAGLFMKAGFPRVQLTPLGYPDSFFRPNIDARNRIRNELGTPGPVVAYFGRLAPEKGVHILLDALDALNGQQDQEWSLLLDDFQVVSDYHDQLRRRIGSSSWSHRVRLVKARHGVVADYMNAADIVVIPSISTPDWVEQYGRVLPEALACGCRVIASNVGALPELMAGHGKLVPESDSPALAKALRAELIELSPEASRNTRGSEYASAHLSASAQARHWDSNLRMDDRDN